MELLITLGIIGLLIGLLLSGVQKVRSSGAQIRCRDNLRQIGVAFQTRHATTGNLPPGVSYENGNSPQPFMTWQARLLPYLEQSALWEQSLAAYQQDRNFQHSPPHVGLRIPLPVFSCPVDSRTQTAHTLGDGKVVALTSYLGVVGRDAFHHDGVLFLDSMIRLTDISDGTSQTLLVGERPASADKVLGWWYAGTGQDNDGEGDSILGARTKNRTRYGTNCPIGPYNFAVGQFDNQCDAFHFWSPHSGGAHFAFADGSVRFLSYSADSVLPALATRAGGEVAAVPE